MTSIPSNRYGCGRHRDPQVLGGDRDGSRRVVALVCVDEPREQVALLVAWRPGRPLRARRRQCSLIVARARWSALFVAATLVSRSVAVSLAGQPSTSRAISAARWRGGRTCIAARNASSMVSRSTTTASGSSSLGATSSSISIGIWLEPRHLGEGAHRRSGDATGSGSRRDRRSSRSGRATPGTSCCRRSCRGCARRAGTSPARRPRLRRTRRASGSNGRAARGGGAG